MSHDQFFFHDLSRFPIVTARHGVARAVGLPFLAVATTGQAVQCARELLGQSGPSGFNVD